MEEYFLIKGLRPLKGEVNINGAKNAALKSIAASILFEDNLNIENIPLVEDIYRMTELVKDLGAEILFKNRSLSVNASKINRTSFNEEIAKKIRASIVLTGPLLSRYKKITFPYPGGCIIGKRPIDLFLEGFKAMGAEISEEKGEFNITAQNLDGCDFTFRNVSVTGTETLMLAAVLANGKTTLKNSATEPEIPALANFLNKCGAKIIGAGTSTIEIVGTSGKLLKSKNQKIVTIPDRIEAGSFLIIGALLGDPLTVTNCNPEHLAVPIASLISMGAKIEIGKNWLKIAKTKRLKNIDIKTKEYPGFPTDLQAPFLVLMTQAEDNGMVFETVFEGRLNYIEELIRMGAKITSCDTHRAIVHGPTPLRGREIESTDIRAGLAFVVAGMIAKGESKVSNIYQIDRGYEKIEERLNNLGANIKRIRE